MGVKGAAPTPTPPLTCTRTPALRPLWGVLPRQRGQSSAPAAPPLPALGRCHLPAAGHPGRRPCLLRPGRRAGERPRPSRTPDTMGLGTPGPPAWLPRALPMTQGRKFPTRPACRRSVFGFLPGRILLLGSGCASSSSEYLEFAVVARCLERGFPRCHFLVCFLVPFPSYLLWLMSEKAVPTLLAANQGSASSSVPRALPAAGRSRLDSPSPRLRRQPVSPCLAFPCPRGPPTVMAPTLGTGS